MSENFVGRIPELKQLNDAYQKMLATNKGSLIFLTGELGIGKTALIEQFKTISLQKESKRKIRYAYAQSSQIVKGCSVGYDVFVRLFQDFAQQSMLRDSNLTNKVMGFFREYGGDVVPDLINLIPFVGQYIGTAVKLGFLLGKANSQNDELLSLSDAHGKLNQTGLRQKQFIDSFRKLSSKTPLILFLDDLQWADESSINLIFQLRNELASMPILLVASFRPQDAKIDKRAILDVYQEIVRYGCYQEIALKELSPTAILLYLKNYFQSDKFTLTSPLVEWLIKMTKGHPLFLTEYLDFLVDRKLLTSDGQLTTNLAQIDLPPKSTKIIQARVDTLDKELQDILTYASFEGQEFTTLILESLLARVSNKTYPNIFSQLRDLKETHQLIKSLGLQTRYQQKTTVYQFSNNLLHSFLLNKRLETEERNCIYKKLYEILCELYKKIDDDAEKAQLVGKLEFYAAETQQYLDVAYLSLARGKMAAERYAIPELQSACETGFNALEQLSEKENEEIKKLNLDFVLLQGRLYDLQLKQRRAKKAYTQAEKLAEEIGAKNHQAKALNRLGFLIYWTHGGPRQAAKQFQKARDILIGLGNDADKRDLATAYIGLGFVTHYKKSAEILEYYKEALQIYQELDDPQGKATCYHNIGTVQDDDDLAMKYYKKSLELHYQYNLPDFERGNTYANMGWIYFKRKDYQTAIDYFNKALEVQVGVNDSHTDYAYQGLSYALSWIGKFDESITAIKNSIEAAKKANNKYYIATGYRDLGQLYNAKKMYKEAIGALEIALNVKYSFSKVEKRNFLKSVYNAMGLAYEKLGNIEQVNECLRKLKEL